MQSGSPWNPPLKKKNGKQFTKCFLWGRHFLCLRSFSTNHRLFPQRRNEEAFAAETSGNYVSIKSCLWLDASIPGTKLNDVIKTYSKIQSYYIKCHLTVLHSALTKYSYKSPLVVIWQVSRSPWVTHLPVRHCWISFPVLVPGMSRMRNHLKCDGFQLSQYHHSWIWECQVPSRTGFCHCFLSAG